MDEQSLGDPLDDLAERAQAFLDEDEKPELEADSEEVEDETKDDEDGQSDETEAEYIEIKHNGRPVKLSSEEAVEYASKGYDYTTKTQELAEQRRQVEQYAQELQRREAFNQQFIQEAAQISALDMQLQRYKEVDWASYTDQDPVEATKAWQRYQILQQQRGEMAHGLTQRQAQLQAEMAQREQAALAEAQQQLERELGKAWNAETRAAIRETAKNYGFSDEELANVRDPRMVKVLNDAYKWRAMNANKPNIEKRVNQAPKLAKPGTKQTHSKSQDLRAQLRKEGSMKAAVAYMETLL